ncbi:hypothetical protein BKI52_05945 [marine bacterium AO1-C]|nr:hypothetical protein BKI52_05945 [marine bacterium AO1-C]
MKRIILMLLVCSFSLSFVHAQNDDLEKEKLVKKFLEYSTVNELLHRSFAFYRQQEYPKNLPSNFWKDIKTKVTHKKKYYEKNIGKVLKANFSISDLTTLAMPPSEKKDSLIRSKSDKERQKIITVMLVMVQPIMVDIKNLIIAKLKKEKLYKKNVNPENCSRFRYGKFITYAQADRLPIFMIRKKSQQIEYSKLDNTKTTFALEWKATSYDLLIQSIYPKGGDFDVFIGDTLKIDIYHIEGNTYSYKAEIKGAIYFGRVSKVPESAEYTDYITGWTPRERKSFMEGCLESEGAQKLGKTKAKEICKCAMTKFERLYPIPSMIPDDIKEEMRGIVMNCLLNNKPKF